ncbi:MAG: AmmeMemoRadiSam system protein B [Deltaproteobacteria bacterium]|nr:AmmeMemoRadiSam system protein B [Deltaproteobacteria bacterium]
MTTNKNPRIRRDLEFFPIRQGNNPFVLVRDPLGLVEEGKAVPWPLYEFMTLLDGTHTVRDIQMALIRQKGGVLVGTDEVEALLAHLDESFLLDTKKYEHARENMVTQFAAKTARPCSHSGRSYPDKPANLKKRLDDILKTQPPASKPEARVVALAAPHIDLSVGARVYASGYQWLKYTSPSRVIVLGVGHQMMGDLFCLTEKDFETPLGVVKNDRNMVKELWDAGRAIISENDFGHRAEHSVEFQVIFLQHLLPEDSFTIIPILCGPLMPSLAGYSRSAYMETAGSFLHALSGILSHGDHETLVVAGVDLSHIGPKFGHNMPATHLQSQSERHDQNLLKAFSNMQTDVFWEESVRVKDQFNVCGFSAMACLMEVLPPSRGQVLGYEVWHEQPTRSAVSFAAVVFTAH